jgi:hypothetical protein
MFEIIGKIALMFIVVFVITLIEYIIENLIEIDMQKYFSCKQRFLYNITQKATGSILVFLAYFIFVLN